MFRTLIITFKAVKNISADEYDVVINTALCTKTVFNFLFYLFLRSNTLRISDWAENVSWSHFCLLKPIICDRKGKNHNNIRP